MHFELNEEQRAIQEMALSFAAERLAPKAVEWDQTSHFPEEVVRSVGELGLGGIYVSEDVGGSGLGRLDAALIFEALATGCPTIGSFISIHNMCAWMLDSFGTEEQRQKWVPKLCAMELICSYCLTEPGAGSDAASLKTRAQADGDAWVLNGTKSFISGGGFSDLYIAMVRTGGDGPKGVSAVLVEDGTEGLSFGGQERKMGWKAQPTSEVRFDDCRISGDHLIGEEGKGFRYAMAGLDGGRINIAAGALGGAQTALNKAIEYAKDRKAFGQPIAGFQSLQFKLADMETELQAARIFLYQAAAKLDAKTPDATKHCAMAKRFVTDVAFRVANEALQIHGGYGYLADFGLEKIVRDLRVHQILEGTNEIMRLIVSRNLLEER
ncbi:acyl-CoA dehydrogenase family protein [Notoacmeibacter ruber]|uniref:Acyl-CoA dehydrogenase n=1 Tax=Notoacmeibacter ruber TaxID=2670375 RepID=A0A3L7J9N9_9HYPH|nr:acyl-CoA dehydrogenase family protein [Notoacmeibacter ruber]RLQ87403.1 acyl-CoA dehydrogenase [Notoacmeibacter ruber]